MDAPAQAGRTCDRADALTVVRTLREAGHVAYFAGGCVRDLLLGLEPKDFDVATDAPPDRVRQLFKRTQAVGQAFGVILVRVGRSQVEVATFRAEGKYLDGRRPSEVRFTTAEEDARRRDFTINGLFLDPVTDQAIDYVGGEADLKAGLIRAIGEADERFEEDHLRLLRAVRFAARFGFEIEPATDAAIRRHAGHLVRISPERVAEELRAMLTPPTRGRAWALIRRYGLDDIIFRYVRLPCPGPKPEVFAGRELAFFDQVAPGRRISFGLALTAAFLDYAARRLPDLAAWRTLFDKVLVLPTAKAVRQSLKISNEESDEMQGALYGLAPLLRDEPPAVAELKRFLARPTAPLSRDLLDALRRAAFAPARYEPLQHQLAELAKTDYAPPPLVTGDDLTAAGFSPGPTFKRVLDGVYDAQLEDRVRTKDKAMALAGRLFAEAESGGR